MQSVRLIFTDVEAWRGLLRKRFGASADMPRRMPISQLVKSIISSRTKDAMSLEAHRRRGARWPSVADLAAATPSDHAEPRAASEALTAAAPSWNADDLLELHIQFKRLGQMVCRFNEPDCLACPLAGCCPTAARMADAGGTAYRVPAGA